VEDREDGLDRNRALRRRRHQWTDGGHCKIRSAGCKLGDHIDRAAADPDGDIEPLLGEEALLDADIRIGFLSRGHPVDHEVDLVGGAGGRACKEASYHHDCERERPEHQILLVQRNAKLRKWSGALSGC